MKQIAQNYKSGELAVLDVPAPVCRPGGVLVRSLYSLISTGTEMMKVSEASMSMVGMARARPDQVKKVLDQVQQQGLVTTYKKVMNKLDSYTPLGYSLCGVVTEVGKGAEEFKVGQLVACAGNEQALHAEYNWVPVNLCVAVPDGVLPEHAAFATVASIAMQGVRRGEVQLGETAAVIGLGLIGQLVVRLLVAAGVQVVGIDPVPDRCRLAEKAGAVACGLAGRPGQPCSPSWPRSPAAAVPTTSSWPPAAPPTARSRRRCKLARDRARVVDIGKMKLDLPWNAYYEKELDVRFSRSYGPGRYDTGTSSKASTTRPATCAGPRSATWSPSSTCWRATSSRWRRSSTGSSRWRTPPRSTSDLKAGALKAIGVLLEYPVPADDAPARRRGRCSRARSHHPFGRSATVRASRIAIGFVGAGNYASSMLLPHLAKLPAASLAHVATTKSLSAVNAQKKFGFVTASTDADVGLRRRLARRDLHRDQARHAREAGLPGAGDRQGGLRREAAGADPRGDRPDRRGHREDRQRPAHGRLQPPVRPAAHRDAEGLRRGRGHGVAPVPGQRRAAGAGQLVPQRGGRGLPVRRRGRPLHRHAGAGGPTPWPKRSTRCAARRRAMCRPRSGSPTGRRARSPT